jgi:lipoyl-dependent peroxiredoxin
MSTPSAPGTRVLYTAEVDVTGGRGGRAVSSTGSLELDLTRPAQRGNGAGTDPEELFAAGYAACFDSAIQVVARREKVTVGPTSVHAAVSLCADEDDVYSIAVELTVTAPECDQDTLEEVLELTDQTCPYSRAVRGNVPVVITGVGRR